ncbi:MAG: hypothetical protein DHS80DRAFT_24983 [Piptocephalis tieghemiana]|nr:MAG: hypothetical protein DHS80DRAFT_24983 [Piptocephalis tieghemiana]
MLLASPSTPLSPGLSGGAGPIKVRTTTCQGPSRSMLPSLQDPLEPHPLDPASPSSSSLIPPPNPACPYVKASSLLSSSLPEKDYGPSTQDHATPLVKDYFSPRRPRERSTRPLHHPLSSPFPMEEEEENHHPWVHQETRIPRSWECHDKHALMDCPLTSSLQTILDPVTLIPRSPVDEDLLTLLGLEASDTPWTQLLSSIPWPRPDTFPILRTKASYYIRLCAHMSHDRTGLIVVIRNITDLVHLIYLDPGPLQGIGIAINPFGQVEDVLGSPHGVRWLHRPIMARIHPDDLSTFLAILGDVRRHERKEKEEKEKRGRKEGKKSEQKGGEGKAEDHQSLVSHATGSGHSHHGTTSQSSTPGEEENSSMMQIRWRTRDPWEYPASSSSSSSSSSSLERSKGKVKEEEEEEGGEALSGKGIDWEVQLNLVRAIPRDPRGNGLLLLLQDPSSKVTTPAAAAAALLDPRYPHIPSPHLLTTKIHFPRKAFPFHPPHHAPSDADDLNGWSQVLMYVLHLFFIQISTLWPITTPDSRDPMTTAW